MNEIMKVMESMGDMGGWYHPTDLIKYGGNASLWFVVGERRIGKTTFYLKLAFELWKQKGWVTMWCRNKRTEMIDDSFTSSFLNTAVDLGWIPAPEKNEKGKVVNGWVTKADGVYDPDGNRVIIFQSISTASNRRGNAEPNCHLMIFDEYQPEDRRYPKHCATMLMSLTKTILSGKDDSMCICLSNFISAGNPYWAVFRIYPEKGKKITYFPDKGIAIEVCRGYKRAIEEGNPWNRVYEAGSYRDYASADEDALFNLIQSPPKGIPQDQLCLKIDGQYYRLFHKPNGLFYWTNGGKPKGNDWYAFVPDASEMDGDSIVIPPIYKKGFRAAIEQNLCRFNNANTMFAVMSMMITEGI